MNFDKIRERYREFIEWDGSNVEQKMTQIASEHAYYLNLYYETSRKKTSLEKELKELYQGKWKYYKYEFDGSLDKSEIRLFIEKDLDVIRLTGQLSNSESALNFFDVCMKNVDQMRWDIKWWLDYNKFKAGLS